MASLNGKFPIILKEIRSKKRPSEALLLLTVYLFWQCDKSRHTVSHTVYREAYPAIDHDRRWKIYLMISVSYVRQSAVIGGVRIGPNYSHSIVPGGFEV